MNRLSSQNKTPTNQARMTSQEYMIHKNIPIPNPAKKCKQDFPVQTHQLNVEQQSQSNSSPELQKLYILLEERNKEIEFLKQTETQNKMFSSQFQEMNLNHQQEVKQLLEQMQNYKQRTQDLKSQLEQYTQELTKQNSKYLECQKERDQFLKENKQYQQEYDTLKMQISSKENEIMTLKDRINTNENLYQNELQQLIQSQELQRRSILGSQVKEFTQQFNQERIQFELQNRNSQAKNQELENKCAMLAQEIERKSLQLNEIQQQNQQLLNTTLYDRMRIVVLNTEIERLWSIVQDYETKNNQLTNSEISFQQQFNEEVQKMQSQLQLNYEYKYQQIELQLNQELQHKEQYESDILILQQQQDKYTEQIRIINEKYGLLEEKCAMLTIELERQQQLNVQLNNQSLTSSSLSLQISQLKSLLAEQESTITKYEMELNNYQQESKLLNNDNDNMSTRISQLEEELIQVKQQSRRQNELKQQLDQYARDLNQTLTNYNEICLQRDHYQQEAENLMRDNQLLEMSINEKEENLQNLSDQINLLENKHRIETDELKKQNEFQRRSLLDQQIRELTQKFNNDKGQLEQQIKQLQQSKLALETKNIYLQTNNDKLQCEYNNQLNELDDKINASERERINQLQEIKDYQINLQQSRNDLQKQKEEIIGERMRIIVLASEVDRLWCVIDDFTRNANQFQEQYQLQNEKIKQMTISISNYHDELCILQEEKQLINESKLSKDNQIVLLTSEIERLRNNEDQIRNDFESQKRQLTLEVEELEMQIEQYQTEMSFLQKSGLETTDLETKFQAERMTWETLKYQYTTKIQDYEQKISQLNSELKRWNIIVEEKTREIEQWKTKYLEQSEHSAYQFQIEQLQQQIMDFEQQNLKYRSQLQSLEKQLQLSELSLQDKTKEVEDIYNLMNKQRKQYDYYNKEADNQRKYQQQISQQLQEFELTNSCLKETLNLVQNENQDLLIKIQYLESTINDRDQMIQKKTYDLNEKIGELDQLKEKYQQKIITSTSTQIIRATSVQKKVDQENQFADSLIKSKIVNPINLVNARSSVRSVFGQLPENQQE